MGLRYTLPMFWRRIMSKLALPTFDTLEYAKRLKDADIPEKQAEAHAQALRTALGAQDAANKENLRDLEADTDSKFERLRQDIRKDMDALRKEIIIKLGSMIIGTGVFLTAIMGVMTAFLRR